MGNLEKFAFSENLLEHFAIRPLKLGNLTRLGNFSADISKINAFLIRPPKLRVFRMLFLVSYFFSVSLIYVLFPYDSLCMQSSIDCEKQ